MEEAVDSANISCSSRNAAQNIIDSLTTKISKTIDDNDYLNDEQKELFKSRFSEIFATAFQINLEIGGKSWADAEDNDTTSEYEPFDMGKKTFIDNTLSTNLNDVVVQMAKYRKTMGNRYKVKRRRLAVVENEYMSKVHVQCEDVPVSSEPNGYDASTTEHLSHTDTAMSNLLKTSTNQMERLTNLEKVMEIMETSNPV